MLKLQETELLGKSVSQSTIQVLMTEEARKYNYLKLLKAGEAEQGAKDSY